MNSKDWINIEDKLPEMYQRVLTCTENVDAEETHGMAHYNGNKAGFLVSGGHRDKYVTHWMPLPELPEIGL